MYERISKLDKKLEVKSQNSFSQIQSKTDQHQPINSPVDRILFLQRTIGNQATARLMKSIEHSGINSKDDSIQAKEIQGQIPGVMSHIGAGINTFKGGGQFGKTIVQLQKQANLTVAPLGNPSIVANAQSRSGGDIGIAYNYTPGWWYSPNSALAGWRSKPLKWEEIQGAKKPPPSGEGIVNWGGGQPTCNLFVYDVLYAAGFSPPLQGNKHYYDAYQTYNRAGALRSYFNLITNASLVQPGDVMATGPHMEIVTSMIRNNTFQAIGAHSDGAYESTKNYSRTMRFLRLVVLGDFPLPSSETRVV